MQESVGGSLRRKGKSITRQVRVLLPPGTARGDRRAQTQKPCWKRALRDVIRGGGARLIGSMPSRSGGVDSDHTRRDSCWSPVLSYNNTRPKRLAARSWLAVVNRGLNALFSAAFHLRHNRLGVEKQPNGGGETCAARFSQIPSCDKSERQRQKTRFRSPASL